MIVILYGHRISVPLIYYISISKKPSIHIHLHERNLFMKKVVLLPGKEKRIAARHPWIFRSDIDYAGKSVQPGDTVSILSHSGRFLAKAMYNPASQIALRIMSWEDEDINNGFIESRIRNAIAYRKSFADLSSCRLVFAESDFLPGLIIDSFGSVLVIQCLSLGMEQYMEAVREALISQMKPEGIWERNDVPVRKLEGMEMHSGLLYGSVPDRIEIKENNIRFLVDVKEGQKTGYFLDQKENRAAIAPYVRGKKVLDCFTHTGSFSIHAGYYGADSVTGVDISEYACAFASENARLNHLSERVSFIQANAFDLLAEQSHSGVSYDTIILDPPAFTKSRSTLNNAIRGYKEINLRAIKMVRDGGFLVTCSCSQHVRPDIFRKMVCDAASDAKAVLRLIEFRSQGKDHPVLASAPETDYLKCGIYQVFHV